jgi:uncharacterized protein (TIGR03435 family)
MRNVCLIALLTASAMNAQPAWKEFSIGPPATGRIQSSAFDIHAAQMPMIRIVTRAYGFPESRIVGPAWLETEKYAITAVPVDPKDFQALLQHELAERFHMIAHKEQRQVPAFVVKPLDSPAKLSSSGAAGGPSPRGGGLEMTSATMEGFAAALADMIHRPVFNETGIDGKFQIRLNWEYNNMASLKTAVRDQLGLQLADEVRAVELLIIDHVEKTAVQ